MARHSIVPICAALLLGACAPETDRLHYPDGLPGWVTFRNPTDATLYLAGCSHFDYEQRIDGAWESQEPATVCVWEGFAEPVPPGGVVIDEIDTSRPGIWRLRYPVGLDCDEAAPLAEGNCLAVVELTSNAFRSDASGCAIGGCSGQLCGEREEIEQIVTTCEWLPHYACFRDARCGRFGPDSACGWEQTPELLACLEENGSPPAPVLP